MCGRYAMSLRPGQIRQRLQSEGARVDEAPSDDDGDGGGGDGGRRPGAPRQSYNFAPGYHGVVYRADVPDRGAGPAGQKRRGGRKGVPDSRGEGEVDPHQRQQHPGRENDVDDSHEEREEGGGEEEEEEAVGGGGGDDTGEVRYKLQSMKWGLVPFWTKRSPDYGSVMKTINCRDDSLAQSGGMWSSMKARKRCVVVAEGFFEWLKKGGGREKVPHYVRRRDGMLMCFAGLWDVVQYENDDDDQKHYTYTIITTSSNKQLGFLHDRMPVILDQGSEALSRWLDPARHTWTPELQALLQPFAGELDVYPVSKEVGKVGNNSPTFVVPVNSRENKNNIANFFAKGQRPKQEQQVKEEDTEAAAAEEEEEAPPHPSPTPQTQPEIQIKKEEGLCEAERSPLEAPQAPAGGSEADSKGVKRERADEDGEHGAPGAGAGPPLPNKKPLTAAATSTTAAPSPRKKAAGQRTNKISATSNGTKSPAKPKQPGMQKITKFFGNSS